jgi:hypothetical protein
MCHYREIGSYQPECSFTLHCVHKQAAAYRPTCGAPEADQPQCSFCQQPFYSSPDSVYECADCGASY